jgi:ubiquinone/menaquinone biosynthesis C-methylase UbiE
MNDFKYAIEDVEYMTFKDNTFDTVVDTFGLEYYLNPEKAIKEMKRVCKKVVLDFLITERMAKF